MRARHKLVAAVLHLALGGLWAAGDTGATPAAGGDVVVDVVLTAASADEGNDGRAKPAPAGPRPTTASTRAATAALADAGVDVAVVAGPAELPRDAAGALLCDALRACRDAGTLKVLVALPALDAQGVCEVADPLGFRCVGVRRDRVVELYRDLYARAGE